MDVTLTVVVMTGELVVVLVLINVGKGSGLA